MRACLTNQFFYQGQCRKIQRPQVCLDDVVLNNTNKHVQIVHGKIGSVAIACTSFVEEVYCRLLTPKDNNGLPKGTDVHDIACKHLNDSTKKA